MTNVPVTSSANLDSSLAPRTLVVGLTVNNTPVAYPFEALLKQSPIVDEVGHVPILIVLGNDKKSVRAFERVIDGQRLEFFLKQGTSDLRLVDAETASEWDFTGRSVSGALAGKQLRKLPVLNDYWFDWKTYHPSTRIYQLGNR